jgi:glycosyltransferase involved in cell wall biosynthesis
MAVLYALRGYDIIHVNATGPALLSFIPRLFGRKVIVTVHGLDWKREKWGVLARWALKLGAWASVAFPQRTVVVSRTLRHHYATEYGRETVYIPNGVNLPPVDTDWSVDSLGLIPGEYILFLSRLVPEKGCHTLIEAFRSLDTRKKLVIVGPPSHSQEYADSLHALAAGDDRIVFTGPLFGADKDAVYRGAYCFVLPSTIEGMAIVLLEAMSYGKCCLCSDIDENLEVIAPSATDGPAATAGMAARRIPVARQATVAYGVWFEVGSVPSLAQALRHLLERPDEVETIGQKARQYVATQFNWDVIAGQYAAEYRSVGAAGRAEPHRTHGQS